MKRSLFAGAVGAALLCVKTLIAGVTVMKRQRCFVQAVVGLSIFAACLLNTNTALASTTTLVDGLGSATPSTTFSAAGAGGMSLLPFQFVGPRFTVTVPSVITEIGAFVNIYTSNAPAVVQIRPEVNGVPDPSTVAQTLTLTSDGNPALFTYEKTTTEVFLTPGTYFALFGPQGADEGVLLGSAPSYMAGLLPVGALDPLSGSVFPTSEQFAAVRVIAGPTDTTPPVIIVPGPITANATSPSGAVVTYSVTASDDVDPNPTVVCTPQSGSQFAIGATTVSCTATDASGNSSHASFTIKVKGAAEQLTDLAAAVKGVGPGKSLAATMEVAQWFLAHGQPRLSCLTLSAFQLEVRAQSGKKIPAVQAAALITDAKRIQSVLGCTK
jgi:hypothetical protein